MHSACLMLALFIPSSRYGGEQGGTALHWNCSSPPLSLSLRPQFTLCRDLVEAASQIKSGRTRSLPLCGSAPSRCREIATGDAFSCNKKWAANFFSAWGCSSLPTATRPCQRCPPSPPRRLCLQLLQQPGAAEMHKRQDARKVGRGHGSKFRPCSG